MIKVYIGASFPRQKEAQLLALRLSPIVEIVSTWHRDDLKAVPRDGEECFHRVMRDLSQVKDSDLVIIFIGDELTGGGRHTELGIAIGMGKNIAIIGEYDSNPFELLPYLHPFSSADSFVKELFCFQDDLQTHLDNWSPKFN